MRIKASTWVLPGVTQEDGKKKKKQAKVTTEFQQVKFNLWNQHGRELGDPDQWFRYFLWSGGVDKKGNNKHLKVFIRMYLRLVKAQQGSTWKMTAKIRVQVTKQVEKQVIPWL